MRFVQYHIVLSITRIGARYEDEQKQKLCEEIFLES
jgi:hypothetical protein